MIKNFLETLAISRRSWVVITSVILLGVILATFLVSLFIRSPNEAAISNSSNLPEVTAKVENKEFKVEPDTYDGKISTGATQDIYVAGASESSVVTKVGFSVGDVVKSGDVIGRVSGNPLIVLQLPFSLYRDINDGDSGDDVLAVQRSLASLGLFRGYPDGRYGALTAQAVERLYQRNGLKPPVKINEPSSSDETVTDSNVGQEVIPVTIPNSTPLLKSEIIGISATQATVASIAPIGTLLSSDKSFATLTVGLPTVAFRATVSQIRALKVGSKLEVNNPTNGAELGAATIQSIGDFTNSSELGTFAGHDVVASLEGDTSGLNNGDKAILVPAEGGETVRGLCVPVTALRQEGEKNYVVLERDRKHYSVTVNRIIDGYAVLKDTSLSVGTEVIVSVQS